MKKMICAILAIAMLMSLAACGTSASDGPATTGPKTDPTTVQPDPTDPVDDQTAPTPEVTKPVETQPVETKPVETVPPETEPTETKPVETVPPETEPTETRPVETKPVETKPTKPAPEPEPEPVKPVSISAKVSGSHTIGDKLSKSDFTVKVTMSDGSVLTDPSGWTASTLTLSSASNSIKVSYEGVSTTITVKATVGAINGMDICKEAIQYLGLNYVYGGNSLTSGTDCSGFTTLIYKKYGISLPRTAAAQSELGTTVSLDEAKPGDLYAVEYTDSQYTGHAGIYIGNGWLLSAWPGSGVEVTQLSSSDTLHRIFENTWSGTDEQAFDEIHAACFSYGMYGTYYRARFYIDSGEKWLYGESPFSVEIWNVVSLDVELSDVPEGYEPLVEAWKTKVRDFSIFSDNGSVGYYNGQWYSGSDLWGMYNAGQIDRNTYNDATEFYGAFWDSSATITNGLGEVVDLSTYGG